MESLHAHTGPADQHSAPARLANVAFQPLCAWSACTHSRCAATRGHGGDGGSARARAERRCHVRGPKCIAIGCCPGGETQRSSRRKRTTGSVRGSENTPLLQVATEPAGQRPAPAGCHRGCRSAPRSCRLPPSLQVSAPLLQVDTEAAGQHYAPAGRYRTFRSAPRPCRSAPRLQISTPLLQVATEPAGQHSAAAGRHRTCRGPATSSALQSTRCRHAGALLTFDCRLWTVDSPATAPSPACRSGPRRCCRSASRTRAPWRWRSAPPPSPSRGRPPAYRGPGGSW